MQISVFVANDHRLLCQSLQMVTVDEPGIKMVGWAEEVVSAIRAAMRGKRCLSSEIVPGITTPVSSHVSTCVNTLPIAFARCSLAFA